MMIRQAAAALLLSSVLWAQSPSQNPPSQPPASQPDVKTPQRTTPPDTKAPAPKPPSAADKVASAAAPQAQKPNRADAYYHFAMAHIYEELVAMYGRPEFAQQAVEEYKLAIQNDPSSDYLNAGLAELYAKTNRIRDAVLEAQSILKRDPNNLEAHQLLGRIYLRSLGDTQAGTHSTEMLRLAITEYEKIIALDPTSVDDHLLLGRLYMLDKAQTKAEAEFKRAMQLQPDSEEAVTNLAYLYNEEGDQARAAQVLNSVPDDARSAKIYSALGYTYEQQHDYKKAIDAYRKATEDDKENLDAVRGLAQNLLNDNQTEAALEQYRNLADADPQDAQSLLRVAEILRRLGRYDEARAELKKAEGSVQDSLEIPYNYALINEAEGKYDEAIKGVQDLLDKTSKADNNYSTADANNRAVFLERLGGIYKEQQKTQLAVDTFRKMLALGGDDNGVRAYQDIIDAYRDAKMWPQATAAAEEAANKFPNDHGLQLVYAGELADTGKADEAVNRAKSLLKGTADDRDVYIGLSQIYTRLKRFTEAEPAIAEAQKLSTKPEDKEYTTFVEASIYEREKKYDKAEQAFRAVLAQDPHNSMALNYLGYMLADRGVRLDESVQMIKHALQLDPQNGAYLDSLGWAYFKQGNYDLAEDNLRRAVSKMGNDATLQQHLGDLYQKTGHLKLAATHWARAIEEWNRSAPADVDQDDFSRTQKKLESARVRLAKEEGGVK
jgi:tetratricopeptide (TPR) repeat protein